MADDAQVAEPSDDDDREMSVADATSVADIERELLGGDRNLTRQEVAEQASVDLDHAQALWRALGFADVEDDERAFTERDAWALRTVTELGEQGWLDQTMQVAMARALGQSLSRLAYWQLATIGSMVAPDTTPDEALERAQRLVPVVEELIGYVWRRHLAAAAARALAADREEFAANTAAVGFADLVGFTALTRELDDAHLAELVETFESAAADIVASAGARLVKSIGDEVLFISDDPGTVAEVAMQLLEKVPTLGEMPDLRVGIGYGTVLSRLGDVYGEPVNLASRLTSIARPGSALVDRELAAVLEGDARWRLRRVTPRPVRGYTLLHPFRLRRAEASAEE